MMWFQKPNASREKGQTLLIVVLVIVVGLTITLSLASRSITNLKVSTEEANSQAALSAAEAGIEQLLKQQSGTISPNQTIGNAVILNATSDPIANKTSFLLNGNTVVDKDEGADLWLSDYSTDSSKIYKNQWGGTSFSVFWSDTTDCSAKTIAAIEVIVVSGANPTSPSTTRYVFDPCSRGNNFAAPGAGGVIAGKNFSYSAAIPVTQGFIARIIPLYTSTVIGISCTACPAFPIQGTIITSTGKSAETQRKIIVYQGYPELAVQFFPYIFFSSK